MYSCRKLVNNKSIIQDIEKLQNAEYCLCAKMHFHIFVFHTEIVFSTLHYHNLPIHLQAVPLYTNVVTEVKLFISMAMTVPW